MPEFKYQPIVSSMKDDTPYRLLTREGVSVEAVSGRPSTDSSGWMGDYAGRSRGRVLRQSVRPVV